MSDTFADSSENVDDNAVFSQPVANADVTKRRGSKYVDTLLMRLHNSILVNRAAGVIGLLSYAANQGVTTMAVNLAIRAADHNFTPTLVIDGDFTSTRVSRLYRHRGLGFAECMNGQAVLNDCVSSTKVQGLNALGAGKASVAKQMIFDQDLGSDFFKIVKHEYRFSVVDLPNIREPSIHASILPHLDGIVLVARYGIRKELLVQTQNKIVASGGNLLGVVMNGNQEKLPRWLPKFLG